MSVIYFYLIGTVEVPFFVEWIRHSSEVRVSEGRRARKGGGTVLFVSALWHFLCRFYWMMIKWWSLVESSSVFNWKCVSVLMDRNFFPLSLFYCA